MLNLHRMCAVHVANLGKTPSFKFHTLYFFWNLVIKTLSFIPPITDLVISTNGIPSYFNQSRSCKQLPHPQTHVNQRHFFIDYRHVHTMPRCSSPQFCRQNKSLWIKIVSTNINGGTMSHNFEIFQNLIFLDSGGYYPLLETHLWHGA